MAAGDVAIVFLEMSLGTRIAVSFPASSTTVADLKRRVSHEHAVSFPDIGQIVVHSIKVEHGGSWYHLSDSMAVRDAFHGTNGAWHLQSDALPLPQQVDQGMVIEGHSSGPEPVSGRGHGYEGSSTRSFGLGCRKRSSCEMLPDQVEVEREEPLTAKGGDSSAMQHRTGPKDAEGTSAEQGAWEKRLRARAQVGKMPNGRAEDISSSESEDMGVDGDDTVDTPPPPQFVVTLKKCHFAEKNGQCLNVPLEFSLAHGYPERSKVVLRMGGESWTVSLKHGHDMAGKPRTSLRYGWHQFCVDNRLRLGETCFFRALPEGGGAGDHHVLEVEVHRLAGNYAGCRLVMQYDSPLIYV